MAEKWPEALAIPTGPNTPREVARDFRTWKHSIRGQLSILFFKAPHELYPELVPSMAAVLKTIKNPEDQRFFVEKILEMFIDPKYIAATHGVPENARFKPETALSEHHNLFLAALRLKLTPPEEELGVESIEDTVRDAVAAELNPEQKVELAPIKYHRDYQPMFWLGDNPANAEIQTRVRYVPIPRTPTGIEEAPIEELQGKNFLLTRINSESKLGRCDDMGGVYLDENGNLQGFAICDGVGSSLAANAAAYNTVHASLQLMRTIQKDSYLTREAWIQLIKNIEAEVKKSFDREVFNQSLESQDRARIWGKELEQKAVKTGSTTLIVGFRIEDYLVIAQVGDGGYCVVDERGEVVASHLLGGEGTPNQIYVIPGYDLEEKEIHTAAIPYKKGYRVFAGTDGLYGRHSTTKSIIAHMSAQAKEGKPVDEICHAITEESREKNSRRWRDDFTLLGAERKD